MFIIENSLQFVTVDTTYLKSLHTICPEVFYQASSYDNKPYLGLFVTNGKTKYVIPLTSAKEKHKSWNDLYTDRFLIYEIKSIAALKVMSKSDIYTIISDTEIKHILSAGEIKKMIPVRDDVIEYVDFVKKDTDTIDEIKYKDLLDREYAFCVNISDKIIDRVNKIYDKQMSTGKILKFGCDFRKLESAMLTYKL